MLILLQGNPGSGKSTLAQQINKRMYPNIKIVSTDDFLVREDGVYRYNPADNHYFHYWNQWEAELYLSEGKDVICDNTNIKRWHCRPYVAAALKYNHQVYFMRATGNYQNVHEVPAARVQQMKDDMEELSVESIMNSGR